jgi:hypothetical protein
MFAEPGALERAAIDQAGEDGEGDSLSPEPRT